MWLCTVCDFPALEGLLKMQGGKYAPCSYFTRTGGNIQCTVCPISQGGYATPGPAVHLKAVKTDVIVPSLTGRRQEQDTIARCTTSKTMCR